METPTGGSTVQEPGAPASEETSSASTTAATEIPAASSGASQQAAHAAAGMLHAASPAAGSVDVNKIEQLVIDALHTVYDPEIPVDIYELGLIYSIDVSPEGRVAVTMTLTTPACPVAGSMPGQVEKTIRMIEGVTDVVVDLVWEPTWGPSMMTESARLQLNMY
jgi:FeS assembly SUF system protein